MLTQENEELKMINAHDTYINGIVTYFALSICTFKVMVFLYLCEVLLKWKVCPEGFQKGLGIILSIFLGGIFGMVMFQLTFWEAYILSMGLLVLLKVIHRYLLKKLN